MANEIALINGKAYDYTDIVIELLGVAIFGVTAISYADDQEKVNNMGLGKVPVSQGEGPINPNGSISLSMNDVEALRDVARDGKLVRLPKFNFNITFLNEQKIVTHRLLSCGFTSDGVDASQGDTDINRAFPLLIGSIKYR